MDVTFYFEVIGNPQDKGGNPQPYFRQTQGSKRTPGALRYHAWQRYVIDQFIGSLAPGGKVEQWAARNIINFRKPIALNPGEEAELQLKIFTINEAHADADNIFKGILDSLFENDKKVTRGKFELMLHPYPKSERVGMVCIKIIIKSKHEK